MIKMIFNYLVFPGFIFLAVTGMLVSWIDRKITARIHWRVGPPLFQPFYDLRKLFFKETIIPGRGNTLIFILSPVFSLLSVILTFNLIIRAWLSPAVGFNGDLIVVYYLFTITPIASILGASASNNPLASLGASREIKSVLSYELPFILSLIAAVVKAKSISLGGIISAQNVAGSFISSASGMLAFLTSIICVQAKLGLVPFDYSEAETELSGGTLIEYSGPLLALWKAGKMMLSVAAPVFIILVFWGSGGALSLAGKYLLLLLTAIVIRNTNPRLRIDQSIKLFWTVLTLTGLSSLLLALLDI